MCKMGEITKIDCQTVQRGVHGEKLVAAKLNEKLPSSDIARLANAISRYDEWIKELDNIEADTVSELIRKMVISLNQYKLYIDLELIFDSEEDFLYRQKGQLKIDNTVLEEFLTIFIKRCLEFEKLGEGIDISSQAKVFSSLYFNTDLHRTDSQTSTGMTVKVKDQDFSISKSLFLKASYASDFSNSSDIETKIGFILAEIKTNLDKTMFQEASATARDVKMAVTGAKYYLLCEFLDMTPISSATTNIDEVLILRKGKRISSNKRRNFSTREGRILEREWYMQFLNNHPFDESLFQRFHIIVKENFTEIEINEVDALEIGYF